MDNLCYNENIGPEEGRLLTTRGGTNLEERFDVLDAQGNKTGRTKPRSAVHRDGDWHRAVDIWVVNRQGEVLLQLRSLEKDSYPNHWDISCGGHVVAGEDSLSAAINELKEELGLDVQPQELQYLLTWRTVNDRPKPGFINNSFKDLYILYTDKGLADLTPQPEEVAELRFFQPQELKAMVERQDPMLVPHSCAYEKLFAILGVK